MAVACDLRDDPNQLVDILSTGYVKLFILVVFILDINMMLAIDFLVLVSQLLVDNK